jgi:membrane-associated phospholipid phosphatase
MPNVPRHPSLIASVVETSREDRRAGRKARNRSIRASVRRRLRRWFVLPRGRRDFLRQLAIWFGFALAYQVARGLADRGSAEALANGHRVIHAERRLGALFEPDVQRPVLDTGGLLLHAVNWTYWLSQFAVVGLALLWVYLRRNRAYLPMRNAIIVTNTIGLLVYVALPTAPPRLFPELGLSDTLAQSEALNHGTGLVQLASNTYAAMPSLHAADALIVGLVLAAVVSNRLAKVVCAAWPLWVAFALMASANHFWLDIAAGALLALVGTWLARRLERRRPIRAAGRLRPGPQSLRSST